MARAVPLTSEFLKSTPFPDKLSGVNKLDVGQSNEASFLKG